MNTTILLFAAVLIEGVVEYLVGELFDHIEKIKPYSWTAMYLAAVLGVLVAFNFQLDLFELLLGAEVTPLGITLTGIAIGRGGNYVHDLLSVVKSIRGAGDRS